jgi:hypothetical protein
VYACYRSTCIATPRFFMEYYAEYGNTNAPLKLLILRILTTSDNVTWVLDRSFTSLNFMFAGSLT